MLSKSSVRLGIRCHPINLWATQLGNDTLWHGSGIYLIKEFQKFIPISYEFVQLAGGVEVAKGT